MDKPLFNLAPFRNRARFGSFLNRRRLLGQGVEIGTHRGEFASLLLKEWTGFLHCVDPWGPVPGYEEQAESLAQLWKTDGNRLQDMEETRRVLESDYYTCNRYRLHQNTSERAAELFYDGQLDFVYIDGDHRTEAVALDLKTWWPKLQPRGILAGHDVLCIGEPNGGWGRYIQAALLPFALDHGLTIHLVLEEDNSPWSFYLDKSEMAHQW